MSGASVTSSKREAQEKQKILELMEEIDSIRSLNICLSAYLEHIRKFKKDLAAVNENCNQLSKVNRQWIDTLNIIKEV